MSNSKTGKTVNLYKLFIIQIYGYLALIPSVLALFVLIKSYRVIDLVIYSIGVLFILILLLINHLEPSVKITPQRVILFNIDRNRPIIIYKNRIEKIYQINNRVCHVYYNSAKYEVKLSIKQMKTFLSLLEEYI